MRVSYNWLKRYIDLSMPPEELSEKLTMAGFEVERIDRLGDKFSNMVTGEVLEVRKHPNADKLSVCRVAIGEESLNIVCGAPNVAQGQKVVVGRVGAEIPRNQHDPAGGPFVLSRIKIRGEESFGMICSEYELDLGDDKDGIMVLPEGTRAGVDLAEYLGLNDTILEVGITPNRPDAMSHVGIAREIAAILRKRVTLPKFKLKEGKRPAGKFVTITIADAALCPRYTARVILGVRIGPSPKWLQDSLNAIGVRPVNNVVDITNFVLMEIGHPLHAFDYDKLSGHAIVIQSAKDGTLFTTLDHKQRKLDSSVLMICDADGPVAIAGLMGGARTEISDPTVNILIESAYFEPGSIRHSSKRFGLSTDASQRFERGADPAITEWAVDRAAQLVQEICGGEILRKAIDVYPRKIAPRRVQLRPRKVNEVLDTKLSDQQISRLLERINIKRSSTPRTRSAGNRIHYLIPTYRPDIEQEIDLIEEVARLFGYNNIGTRNETRISLSPKAPEVDHAGGIREWLIGGGYSEVVSNSMQERAFAAALTSEIVEIANPISMEMAALRPSLLISMVQVIRNNVLRGNKNLRLFEVGKCYRRGKDQSGKSPIPGFVEESHLMLAFCGMQSKTAWDRTSHPIDIYDTKGEVKALLKKIFLDNIKFIPYSTTKALTSMGFDVEINDVAAGHMGKVRKDVASKFDIDDDVYVAELSLDILTARMNLKKTFKPLPKYPSVTRDIAFKVNEHITVAQLENEIVQAGGPLLMKTELFDMYRGDQIQHGEKSLAFALEFLSQDHTLRQEEVDQIMESIITKVARNLGGTLRD